MFYIWGFVWFYILESLDWFSFFFQDTWFETLWRVWMSDFHGINPVLQERGDIITTNLDKNIFYLDIRQTIDQYVWYLISYQYSIVIERMMPFYQVWDCHFGLGRCYRESFGNHHASFAMVPKQEKIRSLVSAACVSHVFWPCKCHSSVVPTHIDVHQIQSYSKWGTWRLQAFLSPLPAVFSQPLQDVPAPGARARWTLASLQRNPDAALRAWAATIRDVHEALGGRARDHWAVFKTPAGWWLVGSYTFIYYPMYWGF